MSPRYIPLLSLRIVAMASFMTPVAYPCAISRADPFSPAQFDIAKGAPQWTRVPL